MRRIGQREPLENSMAIGDYYERGQREKDWDWYDPAVEEQWERTEKEIDPLSDAVTAVLMSIPAYVEFPASVIEAPEEELCEICGSAAAVGSWEGVEVGGESDELRWMSYAVCAGCLRMAERGEA